jgi:hypothetical protein
MAPKRFVILNGYGDVESPRMGKHEAFNKARRWSFDEQRTYQVVEISDPRQGPYGPVVARFRHGRPER